MLPPTTFDIAKVPTHNGVKQIEGIILVVHGDYIFPNKMIFLSTGGPKPNILEKFYRVSTVLYTNVSHAHSNYAQ